MENELQKAVLCGIDDGKNGYSNDTTMAELKELARTAGAECCAYVLQNRPSPDAATMLGEGKLLEAAALCRQYDAQLLIFDDELTGTQIKNIEDLAGVRALDRTALILDIFAGRARTGEGRIQVELAQLNYLLPRLTGMRADLSRLGGGIGTRGPGETQLETDRRHVRRRIASLRRSAEAMERHRRLLRGSRARNGVLTAAIVGYTNAGKSTLFNSLTGAGVLAENKLFATLDPTTRGITLPDGRTLLLTDTVGFIRKLPHQLVDAFHSTLEEAVQADALLIVCDCADPQMAAQLETSDALLRELGCGQKPQLVVLNKADLVKGLLPLPVPRSRPYVRVSAREGTGFDELLSGVAALLPSGREPIHLLLPYEESGLLDTVHRYGAVCNVRYLPEGIELTGFIDSSRLPLVETYRR